MPNAFETENRKRKREIQQRRNEEPSNGGGGPINNAINNANDLLNNLLNNNTNNEPAPKYDLEEIERRRNWIGDQIWRAVASGSLNLKNTTALSNFLRNLRPSWFGGEHGLIDEKEKGRHMRRLFLGDLAEEGWGMGSGGYGKAIDEYRPNWSRMVSGMTKGADGLYASGGGRFYDAFGRLVRTETTPTSTPTPTTTPTPVTNTPPQTPNPTFYGGSAPAAPYGISQQQVASQSNPRNTQRKTNTNSAPAWYSTWRF